MNPSCLVLETKALRAERTISSSTNISVALKAAIDSAELYMQALRLADKSADRSRLDAKCKQMLIKAERLRHSKDRTVSVSKRHHPASVRPLNTKEKIILLEGSKLNGFMFRPWEDAPLGTDFDAKDGDLLFTDSPPLSLSEAQLEHFGGWLRPKDALALLDVDANAGEPLSKEPCMSWEGKVDLVQDLTSDCSVVASLCSATARTERGHAKVSSISAKQFQLMVCKSLPLLSTHMTSKMIRSSFHRTANISTSSTSMAVGVGLRLTIVFPRPRTHEYCTLSIEHTLDSSGQRSWRKHTSKSVEAMTFQAVTPAPISLS